MFDWDRAARRIAEVKPRVASAGLEGDWEWTGGDIYRDGKPLGRDETYTFLASTWALPELGMDGHTEPCYVYVDEAPASWGDDRGSGTFWPESALAILNGAEVRR